MQPGQTLSLTEAGKRLLSDTSPAMKTVNVSTAPKMQTIQIKQEGSPHPKIIRINGNPAGTSLINSSAISASSSGQPRVIRLSSSQLSNLKLGKKSDLLRLTKIMKKNPTFFKRLNWCLNRKSEFSNFKVYFWSVIKALLWFQPRHIVVPFAYLSLLYGKFEWAENVAVQTCTKKLSGKQICCMVSLKAR